MNAGSSSKEIAQSQEIIGFYELSYFTLPIGLATKFFSGASWKFVRGSAQLYLSPRCRAYEDLISILDFMLFTHYVSVDCVVSCHKF